MKRLFGTIAILLMGQIAGSVMAVAQTAGTSAAISDENVSALLPFGVGEKFEYNVGWEKVLTAGKVTVKVEELVDYNGFDTYKVRMKAKSTGAVGLFYSVREELESLIDAKGLFTRRYWSSINENQKLRERLFEFDQENNRVTYKNKNKTYAVPYGIHDEVSAVFYMRTLDLKIGDSVNVNVFSKPNTATVKCNVIKRETITVPAGEFKTILVEPELNFDGVMKKGKMKIWFTDDERRIPVQVKSKIALGSIVVQLKKFELGNDAAYLAANNK